VSVPTAFPFSAFRCVSMLPIEVLSLPFIR
jgi:hypothetical protein